MKVLTLILLLGMGLPENKPKPKVSVTPRIASEPATITFLLTGIPEGARVACFILDGDNYYGGCLDIDGRRSYRREEKNVLRGEYLAAASIDGKLTSSQTVIVQ